MVGVHVPRVPTISIKTLSKKSAYSYKSMTFVIYNEQLEFTKGPGLILEPKFSRLVHWRTESSSFRIIS